MAIVFALCVAYVAYCLGTNPAGPFTTPDSIHYLNASPIVPLGYPFFLKIFGARGAIVAQPILFGAALAFLGREIVRRTRSTWLAVAVVIASMALPQIREFHASILSESLFLSLLIVFLAIGVRFAYHPTWHLMVLVATAAGLNATVRRTAFALLPVMVLMVLFQRHKLRGSQPPLFFVAALAPFLVIVGAEQAAAPVVHAGASSSLMGRHMFAKAALIDAPPAPPSHDRVRAALVFPNAARTRLSTRRAITLHSLDAVRLIVLRSWCTAFVEATSGRRLRHSALLLAQCGGQDHHR